LQKDGGKPMQNEATDAAKARWPIDPNMAIGIIEDYAKLNQAHKDSLIVCAIANVKAALSAAPPVAAMPNLIFSGDSYVYAEDHEGNITETHTRHSNLDQFLPAALVQAEKEDV
jgi:hypothetical protein